MKNIILVICVLGNWKSCNSYSLNSENADSSYNKILTRSVRETTNKTCTTPAQPLNGQWVFLSNNKTGEANSPVEFQTILVFTCKENYKLSSTNENSYFAVCLSDGGWSTALPTCQNDNRQTPVFSITEGKGAYPKVTHLSAILRDGSLVLLYELCPKVYNSPTITVTCKKDGSEVPCDKATDLTVLTYKCAPYYEKTPSRPEKSVCFEGSWDYTPNCTQVCGEKRVSETPLIIDGKEVERGHYPWVVALYSNKDSEPYFTNICSGTMLTNNHILTAAICVTKKETGKQYPTKYYQVAAGKYYNQYNDSKDSDTAQYSEVEEIFVHPNYRGEIQNFRGDIAILKLKSSLSLSKVVQPVCYHNLPTLEESTKGLVTGWGYTTASGNPSETLKELDLTYISDEECFGYVNEDFANRYFTADKICSIRPNNNTGLCKGDTGGGLYVRNPQYKNRYFIHGILSLVPTIHENQQVFCDPRVALFTRVGSYLEWIQLTVRRSTPMQTIPFILGE